MILIFGGAYQGKLSYVKDRFQLGEEEVYRCDDIRIDIPGNKKIIDRLDQWILALVKNESNIEEAVNAFIVKNKKNVIICTDISGGIVPIDPVLRKWREETGRMMAKLSRQSEETIRLFCGIPMRIDCNHLSISRK